jgi:hypothetical protein
MTIESINLESLRHRSIHGLLEDQARLIKKVEIEFVAKGDESYLTVGIFANNLIGYKRQ